MKHRAAVSAGRRRVRRRLSVCVAVLLVLALGGVTLVLGSTVRDGPIGGVAVTAQPSTSQAGTSRTPTPSPSPPAPAEPTVPSRSCTSSSAIASWPLRERLAQLLIVGVDASGAAEALSVVRTEHVGGIFLAGDGTGLLTSGGLARVREASPVSLIVAVDDEGGRVQQVDQLVGDMPSARRMAATMTPAEVYRLALRRGRALAERGVTMNFAPVLDVSAQPADAVIGDRSFSGDPAVVARYAGAFARGMREAGVLPVFKHFPGHGRATGDSHRRLVTTPPLSELREVDLLPYRKLLGRGKAAVMLGHLRVPGLTEPGVPASLSPAAVSLLRDELGFDGLIVTDDLFAMDAIRDRYSVAEAARAALVAGVDMALMISSTKLDAVLDHLEQAVLRGTLPESRVNESVARVLRAKGVDPCAMR